MIVIRVVVIITCCKQLFQTVMIIVFSLGKILRFCLSLKTVIDLFFRNKSINITVSYEAKISCIIRIVDELYKGLYFESRETEVRTLDGSSFLQDTVFNKDRFHAFSGQGRVAIVRKIPIIKLR